jgi:hypothetical protein
MHETEHFTIMILDGCLSQQEILDDIKDASFEQKVLQGHYKNI